jgi:CD36 family
LWQNVVLKNDTDGYKAWLTPQAPVYIDFYFFNVTNSPEFTSNWSIKPRVKQIGPYVYKEVRNKTDIDFGNAGSTLRYREQKFYVFERSLSCGDENDTFTTVNLPLLVSYYFDWLNNGKSVLELFA